MLNRRYLRVKILQALYAWVQSGSDDLPKAEREMQKSTNQVYDLYFNMLLLVEEVFTSAQNLIEVKKEKILPTQDDLNPNLHFVNNKAVEKIVNNTEYRRGIDTRKLTWDLNSDNVRKLFRQIEASKLYKTYMEKEEDTFKNDKAFLIKIYEEFFVDNEVFDQLMEEQNMYWVIDLEIVNIAVVKTLQRLKERYMHSDHILADLFKDREEDTKFTKELFRKTLSFDKDYSDLIEKQLSNWDIDRLAQIDIILLKMALCEFEHFSGIPVKVTMNEYIDLSKNFSTPRSKGFINGVLDKIVAKWKDEGRINKTGRGLIE